MKTGSVQCGKAHAGNKTLVKLGNGFAECIGCGQCYTMAQVEDAKHGDLAGCGLPYVPKVERPAHYVNQLTEMGVTRPLSRAIRCF